MIPLRALYKKKQKPSLRGEGFFLIKETVR